jgi:hypothetical protein
MPPEPGGNALKLLFNIVFTVAVVEEGLKYLVIRLAAYRRPEFDEPYDGIMYAAAVSLGFAAAENLMYVVAGGVDVGWFRMFTAVPMHAMAGVLMGYYLGLARFETDAGRIQKLHVLALASAITAHGTYDYFVMSFHPFFFAIGFLILLVQISMARRAMRIHEEQRSAIMHEAEVRPPPETLLLSPHPGRWALIAISFIGTLAFGLSGLGWIVSQNPGDFPDAVVNELTTQSAGMGVLAAAALFILVGLLRGWRWSWRAAFTVFLLTLPTPVFPLSIAGLYGLYQPELENRFLRQR